MLDPTRDYTNIRTFELRAVTLTRRVITTPATTAPRAAATTQNLIRFAESGLRLTCQVIPLADLETPAAWNAAFADITGEDISSWAVGNMTPDTILLAFKPTATAKVKTKLYTQGTGWGAAAAEGIDNPFKIAVVNNYGMIQVTPAKDKITGIAHAPGVITAPDQTIIPGETISDLWGFYDQSLIAIVLDASGADWYTYYHFGQQGQTNFYQLATSIPGDDFKTAQIGDLIITQVSHKPPAQGYHPFFLRTLWNFEELPFALSGSTFYTANGVAYDLTHTTLGQIKEFTQDWKTLTAFVPILDNPFDPYCTAYLRRTYNDGTILDSPQMSVETAEQTPFGTTFTCLKIQDGTAWAMPIHHLALSQPHLKLTHSLPLNPTGFTTFQSSIYRLLREYQLTASHETASLLQMDYASITPLTSELYTIELTPEHKTELVYYQDGATAEPILSIANIRPGIYPPNRPFLPFLKGGLTAALWGPLAFYRTRATYELPPGPWQIGDQVITAPDWTQAGQIIDIKEKFTPAKWRHYVTAAVAAITPPNPTIRNKVTGSTGPGTTITLSHTIAPGPGRLLIVAIQKRSFAGAQTNTVTFGGAALTKLTEIQPAVGNYPHAEIWYLPDPAIQTANIVITFNAADFATASSLDLTYVKTSAPFGTILKATGAASPASLSPTAATSDLIFDLLAYEGTSATPTEPDQTQQTSKAVGTWHHNTSTHTGAAPQPMTWAITGLTAAGYAQIAVPIIGARTP